MPLPDLDPHELEALALLMEECAETAHAIGKALRHGMDSTHPSGTESNRDAIVREAGQVIAAIEIAISLGIMTKHRVDDSTRDKWSKVGKYLHHIDIGTSTTIRHAWRKP